MAEGVTERNQQILAILHEDTFEGQTIDPDFARHTEVNFYRGAPPQWLNFYLAEQNTEENGSGFIKRDGYEELHERILSKTLAVQKMSYISFSHEPGSGGTTLAMQLLWDLKSSFRCAVLVDTTLDVSVIAFQVIELFTGGQLNINKTVLLLLQGKNIVFPLQNYIREEMSKRQMESDIPIVVILYYVRRATIDPEEQKPEYIYLRQTLSDNEKIKFEQKKKWLARKYINEHEQFHGFNIMQTNFSHNYVNPACNVFNNIREHAGSRGLKLSACMCLLNSYVPDSFFLKSHCEAFLQTDNENRTFEEIMEPFSHLMVSFNPHGREETHVRMAHPMIANRGTCSLYDNGVNRSDTALDLLSEVCNGDITSSLTGFAEDLIIGQVPQKFHSLSSDIKTKTNGKEMWVSVLQEAIKTLPHKEHFHQMLSCFYYQELKDYSQAEEWAKKAQTIAPHDSLVADTLGQVYKHHLLSKLAQRAPAPEILALANNAFKAFEHEENLAEEEGSERFNFKGTQGYLQVANTLFSFKDTMQTPLTLPYLTLPEIRKRANFIRILLTYSKKHIRYEETRVLEDAQTCYENYTGEALPTGLERGTTEEYLCFLHQNWPKDTQERRGFDFKKSVQDMKSSYQKIYEKHLRFRYLRPLRFLCSEGFQLRVLGVVRHYRVYTTVGDEEIELDVGATQPPQDCRSGLVSFDLGFTIRGPTAYEIQYED